MNQNEPVNLAEVHAALANGSLPIEVYKELIERYNEENSPEPDKKRKKNGDTAE